LQSVEQIGNAPTYRIGAVSRLTGVPADTLRVWERRYTVVAPMRSDTGTRLYGPEDVGRLALIKRLVDRGDAISTVANLSLEQLRQRFSGADLPEPEREPERRYRISVLGSALAERLRAPGLALGGIDIVGIHDSPHELIEAATRESPDLLLFDCPTVHSDQVGNLTRLLARTGASRAILVYHFASRSTLERLDAASILAKRAPVDAVELGRLCFALRQGHLPRTRPRESLSDPSLPIPPRRFADADLARISAASSTLRCECPHHLADLVSSLAAFEAYCDECASRGADEDALHAMLHASTAHARALMENALARVVESEGIELACEANRLRG
jgi:MerR family transcriptional regulator, light-induced transcriptional regulator